MAGIEDLPIHLRILAMFFDFLPEPNTASGLIAYSTILYIIYLIFLFIKAYFSRDETETRIREEEEFKKNLEVVRKVKSKEADQLLKKLFGDNSGQNEKKEN